MIILFWQVYFIFSFLYPTESVESTENYEYHPEEFEGCNSSPDAKKFLSPHPWTDKFVRWAYILENDDTKTDNQKTYKEIHNKKD